MKVRTKLALPVFIFTMLVTSTAFADTTSNMYCKGERVDSANYEVSIQADKKVTDGVTEITFDKAALSCEESDVKLSADIDMYSINVQDGNVKISYISEKPIKEGELMKISFDVSEEYREKDVSVTVKCDANDANGKQVAAGELKVTETEDTKTDNPTVSENTEAPNTTTDNSINDVVNSITDSSDTADTNITVEAAIETNSDNKLTVSTSVSVVQDGTQKNETGATTLTKKATDAIVSKIEKTIKAAVDLLKLKGEDNVAAPTVSIKLGDVTAIPSDIFKAAKGSDVNLVLKMDGYSWKINGKNISDAKDVNLEVKKDTSNVPADTVKKLAGDRPTTQLSLTHDGELGFTGTLCLELEELGKGHVGEYANLYYYNEKNELVFQCAGKILADGSVELEFSHASEYVVVIDKKAAAATGDTAPIVPFVVLFFVGVAVIIGANRIKAKN